MNTKFLFLAAFILFGLSIFANASDKEDAEALNKLLVTFQKALPEGWQVDYSGSYKGEGVELILRIQSSEKIPVSFHYPNPGAKNKNPSQSEVIWIDLNVSTPMSPETYQDLSKKNVEITQRRTAFMQKFLKNISGGFMEAIPYRPSCYTPKTDLEKQLVMEYWLLWLREPTHPLPTHYLGNHSFILKKDHFFNDIEDDVKKKEYEAILKSIDTVLAPYEKK